MRHEYLSFLLIIILLASCRKDDRTGPGPLPPDPPSEEPSIERAFLKDIIVNALPSPYYHFEYNEAGKVNSASFASGFTQYHIEYFGEQISALKNNTIDNKDWLLYSYDASGRATEIVYESTVGTVFAKVHLTYSGQKLIKLRRERKLGTDFIENKVLTLSYYADGNVKEIEYFYPATPINGQIETRYIDHFEQYDNGLNVDGFSLIHDEFFDHLVFLPGLVLQKNNPVKIVRTGNAENFNLTYSYSYNNKNFPLSKTGELTYITGPNAGRKFPLGTTFTYY